MINNTFINKMILSDLVLPICIILGSLYLDLIPLPDFLAATKPDFMLLVFVFFVLNSSYYLRITFAFFLGIFLDVLYVTPLGYHALQLVMLSYLIIKFKRQLSYFPIWQQSAYLSVFIVIYAELFSQLFVGKFSFDIFVILKFLSTYLMWPWLNMILNQWYPRGD